ncbi:uncharacterized protein LOC144546777 [Carex rostrata]
MDDVDWTEVMRPNPHFFRVLVGDFTQRMKIPPNFVKNLQEDMTTKASSSSDAPTMTASIEGPTGRTWYAEIEKTTTGVFFTRGWSKFVQNHSLKEHELLIFRYNGCMSFTVLIFDKTACEKEDSDGGSGSGGRKGQLKPRKLAFGHAELGDRLKLKEKSVFSTEPKITDTEIEDEEEMHVVETSKRKRKKPSERRKRGPVPEKEKLKAREAAHSFASENPFFVICLKSSHVYNMQMAKHITKRVTALLVPPEVENKCDRPKHPIKDKRLPESSRYAVDLSRELSPFGMGSF